jgi:hypothetical protein
MRAPEAHQLALGSRPLLRRRRRRRKRPGSSCRATARRGGGGGNVAAAATAVSTGRSCGGSNAVPDCMHVSVPVSHNTPALRGCCPRSRTTWWRPETNTMVAACATNKRATTARLKFWPQSTGWQPEFSAAATQHLTPLSVPHVTLTPAATGKARVVWLLCSVPQTHSTSVAFPPAGPHTPARSYTRASRRSRRWSSTSRWRLCAER